MNPCIDAVVVSPPLDFTGPEGALSPVQLEDRAADSDLSDRSDTVYLPHLIPSFLSSGG